MNINDAIEQFFQFSLIEKGLQKTTIEGYREDFKCFFRYFPSIKDTDDLSDQDIQNFMYKQGIDEFEASTISRRVSTITVFFKFLEHENIRKGLVTEVLLPKKEKHIPIFLTVEEVQRLLNVPNLNTDNGIMDKAMLEIAYGCGLRVSELCTLKTRSVNFQEKFVKIFNDVALKLLKVEDASSFKIKQLLQ